MKTAIRVSEIHALAMDFDGQMVQYISQNSIGFSCKNQLPSKCPSTINIPNLAKNLTRQNNNRLLCLVRALKCFLDKTKALRKNRPRLFITVTKDRLQNGLHLRSKLTKGDLSFLKIKGMN